MRSDPDHVWVRDERGQRSYESADFPLKVGGEDADIALQGLLSADAVAFLGISEGRAFVQPGLAGIPVFCNERLLESSCWLADGDTVRIETTRIICELATQGLGFSVETPPRAASGELPPIVAPPSPPDEIEAVAYRSAEGPLTHTRRRFGGWRVAIWAAFALLSAVAWYLFTARAVSIQIEPPPDDIAVRGGLLALAPALDLAGRTLLRPGTYEVLAEKEGYHELREPFDVGEESFQEFVFTLRKLPGLLGVVTAPVTGAEVYLDEALLGVTPLAGVEVEPGEHRLRVVAERYFEQSAPITIEGMGVVQTLEIALEPRWADIRIASEPPGAELHVDGEARGPTPLSEPLLEGARELSLRLAGYQTWTKPLIVEARKAQDLGTIALERAEGTLRLQSSPSGASVSVDGAYRGQTPVEVTLAPGSAHEVSISKRGHETSTHLLELDWAEERELSVALQMRYGRIEVRSRPADARLSVDGVAKGAATQRIKLSALPHVIEIAKEGYRPFRKTVTPRPGFPQVLDVVLVSHEQVKREATPERIETSQGQELLLVQGGPFQMGAPRRQQGRRANEALRQVELTRPFYISTTEVSNEQFREFRAKHASGRVDRYSLDGDDHPVALVSWLDAARFANWLSAREGLPLAYVPRGGSLVPSNPPTKGYRLPTEAEWAWVARYAGRDEAQKFPWPGSFPPPQGLGNFADVSARGVAPTVLPQYDDGYPVTSPVGSFPANPVGIHDLGGNVAEWVQDFYSPRPQHSDAVERDPIGPDEGAYHVIRGSGWKDAGIGPLRLTYRDYGAGKRPDVGFRIARYAE